MTPHRVVAFASAACLTLWACSDAAPRRATSTPSPAAASPSSTPSPSAAPGRFTLVGHDPLHGRGMNAGLALHGDYAYIGNRTDGSKDHPHPGVLIVDVADPASPRAVGEIEQPHQQRESTSSRELRVWHAESLLFVLNIPCTPSLHRCARGAAPATVEIYDIEGSAARVPTPVATYRPSRTPHEFFLWTDAKDRGRALLYLSTPGGRDAELVVADVSRARSGIVREIATWREAFPERGGNDTLHSLSVSPDGTRAYLAHLTAGFLVIDTSQIASRRPSPAIVTVTAISTRPRWPGRGAHSAVKVPGRPLIVTTDEAYGSEEPGGGCPFGWMRVLDIADEIRPRVASEAKVAPYNNAGSCDEVPREHNRNASFSTHNPTVTANLALVSWHGAGLQAVSIADPAKPARLAEFLPAPLSSVTTEDPALTAGAVKVAMWSYPIIKDGLIYVVDVRNGLFVLRFEGRHGDEVAAITFAEGNTNGG